MTREYGSLNRRSQSAGWQWFALGTITGIIFTGCLVVTGLAMIAFDVVELRGVSIGPSPQPVVQIITATPQPATATPTPTETPMPTPTVEVSQAEVVVPTATTGLSLDAIPVEPVAGAVAVEPTQTREVAALLDPNAIAQPGQEGAAPPLAVNPPVAAAGEIPAVLELLQSDLISIDGGTFQMGSSIQEAAEAVRECQDVFGGACTLAMAEDSSPPRTVQLSPYQIEQTEVTYEQYIAFLNFMGPRSHLNGCNGQPCLATRNETDTSNVSFDSQTYDVNDVINNLPVVNVTWFGAQAYCEALNRRLPTEAEWEFAARGIDGRIYPWGNGPFDTTRAKTNRPIPENELDVGAVPVGTYTNGISPFGAFDMAGNVAEWVADWYGPTYYSQPDAAGLDPRGPLGGTDRVIRGGSWDAVPFFARAVHRQHLPPNDATPWLGFRCAADPDTGTTGLQTSTGNQVIPANPVTPNAALSLDSSQLLPNNQPTLAPGSAEEQPIATLQP